LDQQVQYLKDELQKADDLITKQEKQIKNKNEALDIIEKEILSVKARQDQDMDELQDKSDRVLELEQILRQCNESLIQKKGTIQQQESQIGEMQEKLGLLLRSKDQKIGELSGQIAEMEEEMKVLVMEIER
jgi:hypothetical protein